MQCSQCNGTNFDEDPARGDMVCVECGAVASENAVTSSVEYVENPSGTATALGNFVSSESQMPGFRESRYITEQKARKRIETICGQLRLGADVAVSAFRYYQSALFRGFTRGRSSLQLAAACIYVAARQLRVNLMLLDLSDAVAINVYHVGRTYIDLKRRLNLALPEVDPCLFVERFASQLDFEDKTAIVATTAMRLLQRMKKDWISTGRRPSGLAAASLLVAARIHEFNRTEEDVAKVARISQMTARKRLIEFSKTPSSALSIDAFFTVDYDEEQDPPCFGQPAQKRRFDLKDLDMEQVSAEIKELGRRIDQELNELANKRKLGLTSNDPDLVNSKGLKHLIELDSPITQKSKGLDEKDEDEAEAEAVDLGGMQMGTSETSSSPKLQEAKRQRSSRQVLRDVLDGVVDPEILDSCVEDLELITAHSGNKLCELVRTTQQWRDARDAAADIDAKHSVASPSQPSLSALTDDSCKLPHFLTPFESAQTTNETSNNVAESNEIKGGYNIDLSDIDEEELNREYFLTPREVMVKATLWFRENAPFLEEQRRKKAERQRIKAEVAKHPKRPRRCSRKIYQRQRRMPWHSTSKLDVMDEEEESQLRPISKKINYEALEAIVGEKTRSPTASVGQPSPSLVEDSQMANDLPVSPATPRPPNRLLEKTIKSPIAHLDHLPATFSSPALTQGISEQQAQEDESPFEAEELEELEDDEEVDWHEGDDLW